MLYEIKAVCDYALWNEGCLWVCFMKWRLFVSMLYEMKAVCEYACWNGGYVRLCTFNRKLYVFIHLEQKLFVTRFPEFKDFCQYDSQTESCWWLCVSNWYCLLACFLKSDFLLIMPLSFSELNAAFDEVKTSQPSLVPIYRNTWLHMSVFVVLLFLPRNVLLVLIRLADVATRCKIWSLKSLRCWTRRTMVSPLLLLLL